MALSLKPTAVDLFTDDEAEGLADTAFHPSGKQAATSYSNGAIKVWEQDESSTESSWHCAAQWQEERGEIVRLTWCPPAYGHALVMCVVDGSVVIRADSALREPESLGDEMMEDDPQHHWKLIAVLQDSRKAVVDAAFAPAQLGCWLATASSDGWVRVYKPTDVLDIQKWRLQQQFEACPSGSCTSLSWRPTLTPGLPPMLAVGCSDGTATMWGFKAPLGRWLLLTTLTGHPAQVTSISWAPNMGRSLELIAVASGESVHLWQVQLDRRTLTEAKLHVTAKHEQIAVFDDHHSKVWKVEWNFVGNTLASSGEDGQIRLWVANVLGEWGPLATLTAQARAHTEAP
eukprot:jgi/Chlat1/4311/Chrsp29S04474